MSLPPGLLNSAVFVALCIAGYFSLICYELVAMRFLLLVDISGYIKATTDLKEALILSLALHRLLS